ncbi:MAG: hypothetical protein RBT87_03815 [bacterium]|jgi:hypothetical protein|nr:hypothetical protein [bacterium]
MSAVVQTLTPFIEKSCLLKALQYMEIRFSEQRDKILIQGETDTYFDRELSGKFKLTCYFYTSSVVTMLPQIEQKYIQFYKEHMKELEEKRLEAERARIENERRAYVEKQRQEIIKKAEAKGYKIKEKRNGNEIQLVLVKHTY